MKRILLVIAVAACAGCAEVQSWEKGMLALPEMGFDTSPLETRYGDHTYTSREGASGGTGVGGGGCGCN
ncbi:DUF4266 domain-containing protein [Noviherbaspirillum denitrificans]|uniref:DUF4266 domain-containing protein n=1 Tax=Noviherbaspirillum denitrificans TaxID=1968433 RepID=A0A254TJA0_9BURK|nr:DUF4266 domain-containing protein [Noviherbaspirillum denitrificans]OWW21392.1 hypothetical protein AYR66_19810 [Noviherbaspirillum denitrificans]